MLKRALCLLSFFSATAAFAQQSELQNQRPQVFTQPAILDWRSIPFETLQFRQTSVGGAAVYDFPSRSSAKINLKIVLPESIFAQAPSDRTTLKALSDMLVLGGFGGLTFEQIQNNLAQNGIDLATGLNANGEIVIAVTALGTDFDLVLDLVQRLLFTPTFNPKALTIWKQQAKESFTALMDANTFEKQMRFIDTHANILAFGPNHYFSQGLKRLTPAEIDQVSLTRIQELYKRAFNKNGLKVWLAGNYSTKNLSTVIDLVHSMPYQEPSVRRWLPARELASYPTPLSTITAGQTPNQEPSQKGLIALILKKDDMTQCNISLRYYFSHLGKLNELEETSLSVLSEIFSATGGVVGHDRFSKALRSESGISYSPHASFQPEVVYPNTNRSAFFLNFQAPNEQIEPAVTLAHKTWRQFVEKGITVEELTTTQAALMNRLLASEKTIFDKMNDVMNDVLRGRNPIQDPLASQLLRWEQVNDVQKLNSLLQGLAQEKPLAVLVIMGNPLPQQIAALTQSGLVSQVSMLDFATYVKSLASQN